MNSVEVNTFAKYRETVQSIEVGKARGCGWGVYSICYNVIIGGIKHLSPLENNRN